MQTKRVCSKCNKSRVLRAFPTAKARVCTACRKKRVRKTAHHTHLTKTYAISRETYDLLFAAQGGCCAICNGKRFKNLDVDHDHKMAQMTGSIRDSVRGLLCARCNRRLLVAALNDPAILRRAADYLEHPPARAIIREALAL